MSLMKTMNEENTNLKKKRQSKKAALKRSEHDATMNGGSISFGNFSY